MLNPDLCLSGRGGEKRSADGGAKQRKVWLGRGEGFMWRVWSVHGAHPHHGAGCWAVSGWKGPQRDPSAGPRCRSLQACVRGPCRLPLSCSWWLWSQNGHEWG